MIEERRQDICKHLENPDDENAHEHPFANLLRQRRFHDLTEEETERGYDGGDDDRRPDCEALAEYPFIHVLEPLIRHSQDILIPDWLVRPIFDLQQHRAALQALQVVPLPDGDVDDRTAGDHVDGVG
jgi:hypothetical protein